MTNQERAFFGLPGQVVYEYVLNGIGPQDVQSKGGVVNIGGAYLSPWQKKPYQCVFMVTLNQAQNLSAKKGERQQDFWVKVDSGRWFLKESRMLPQLK